MSEPKRSRRGLSLDDVERATPWILAGMIAVLVVGGVLGMILGAPWAR